MSEVETRKEELKWLIDMLKWDIETFWPAWDDIARLNAYKKELEELENQEAQSEDNLTINIEESAE